MAEKVNKSKSNMKEAPDSYSPKAKGVEKSSSSLENNAGKDKNLKSGIEEGFGGIVVREEDLGGIQFRWI